MLPAILLLSFVLASYSLPRSNKQNPISHAPQPTTTPHPPSSSTSFAPFSSTFGTVLAENVTWVRPKQSGVIVIVTALPTMLASDSSMEVPETSWDPITPEPSLFGKGGPAEPSAFGTVRPGEGLRVRPSQSPGMAPVTVILTVMPSNGSMQVTRSSYPTASFLASAHGTVGASAPFRIRPSRSPVIATVTVVPTLMPCNGSMQTTRSSESFSGTMRAQASATIIPDVGTGTLAVITKSMVPGVSGPMYSVFGKPPFGVEAGAGSYTPCITPRMERTRPPQGTVARIERACFPADAIIGGGGKAEDVEIDDVIQCGVGSERCRVHLFTHRLRMVVATFLEIVSRSERDGREHKLVISQGHYLYINGGLKAARAVGLDDLLLTENGERAVVRSVRKVVKRGLYNIHTETGEMVVDGIVVSCYTEALRWEIGHAVLCVFRVLNKVLRMVRFPGVNGKGREG